ncbi:MAG: hypothetical protein A4E53_01880 [Pelotomaculum sp. PtaB.Bin104]|nr:MAG: hypothetical protein A4E53_01880 [Pelotomaculum sp. PtaB.Bin104]
MKRTVTGAVVVLVMVVFALGLVAYADESNRTGENQVNLFEQDSKCEVTIEKVNDNIPDDSAQKLDCESSKPSSQGESNILQSQVKVGLPEAAKSAADAVPGRAVKAELEEEDGQVIYSVDVATDNGLINVIVDPGTGNVLFYGQDSGEDKDDNQDNSQVDIDGEDDDDDDDDD